MRGQGAKPDSAQVCGIAPTCPLRRRPQVIQPLERPQDEVRGDVIVALVASGARAEVGFDAVGSIFLYEWLGWVRGRSRGYGCVRVRSWGRVRGHSRGRTQARGRWLRHVRQQPHLGIEKVSKSGLGLIGDCCIEEGRLCASYLSG